MNERKYTAVRYSTSGLTESKQFAAKDHTEALNKVQDFIDETKRRPVWTRVWVRCDTHMSYIYDYTKPKA